jgi:hypothetical protein
MWKAAYFGIAFATATFLALIVADGAVARGGGGGHGSGSLLNLSSATRRDARQAIDHDLLPGGEAGMPEEPLTDRARPFAVTARVVCIFRTRCESLQKTVEPRSNWGQTRWN